ncbi:MAG: alpha/beta hydrolase-fold protein [Candidatus Eisenbacteria bacterium]
MSALYAEPGPGAPRLAIRRLLDPGPPGSAEIDAFLAQHAFPLIEGMSVTFVWRGEADAVRLRHFIYGLPASQAFARVEGTDLWHLTLELPDRSRVEYKLEIERAGHGEWIEDPRNPFRAHDPFGANSVVHARGYEVPAWTRPDPETRPGTIEDHVIKSRALGRNARVGVYLPARFRPGRRYPLLVVHDGGDYLAYSGLKTVLDNLIHRVEVADLIVALTYPENRLVEYADHEPHARFLTQEVLPWLSERWPLTDAPAARCLMGASFGAVASLSTAWRYPETYGRLLLQSGSFAFSDIGPNPRGPAFAPIVRFMNEFRDRPARVAERVFVSCGQYESLIYENRSLVPLLQSTGMEVRFVEARDGHNWENWRDRLRAGLSWLFPGPIGMIYE